MIKESFLFTIGAALSGSFASTLGKAAGDVKSLGREVESINKRRESVLNLAKLRTERDALGSRVSAAKAEREQLTGKSEATAERLAALRKEQARMEALRKKGYEPADPSARARLGDAIRETAREQEAIRSAGERNRKETAALGKEYSKLNFVIKGTETRLAKAGVDLRNLADAEKHLADQSKRTALQLERDNRRVALDDAKSRFKDDLLGKFSVIKAAALATAGTLTLLAHGTASAADGASALAERIGMTTRELQELQYAGTRSNIEIGEMDGLLEKFTVRLQDAAHGGGDASDALLRLNLDARTLAANGPAYALDAIADAFERIPSAGERALLSTRLFGKDGVRLGAMLAEGSKGLAKYREEARRVGFVMSDELVESGKKFDASQKRLGASLIGLRNIIGGAMLPAFSALADAFTDYLIANGDEFRALAESLGRALIDAAPSLFAMAKGALTLGVAFVELVTPVLSAISAMHGWPIVIGLLAGGLLGRAVVNLFSMARATWALVVAQRALNAGEAVSWASKAGRAWGALRVIGGTLLSFLPAIGSAITGALLPVAGFALKIGAALLGAGEAAATFLGAVMTPVGWITAAFATGFGIGTLLTRLSPVKRAMYAVGDGITWVWEKITGLGDTFTAAFEKAKTLWEYISGKRLFKWFADKTESAGYAIGDALSGGFGGPQPVGAAVAAGARISVPPAASSSRSVTVTNPVTVTVNAAPGQSTEAIARRTAEIIKREQRDASRSSLSDS